MKLKKLSKIDKVIISISFIIFASIILFAQMDTVDFSQNNGNSAPQANIYIESNGPVYDSIPASVKITHLGGDSIHFEGYDLTRVTASLNGGYPSYLYSNEIGNFSVDDETVLYLTTDGSRDVSRSIFGKRPVSGDTLNIKIIDLKTNQLISNKDVKF